MHTLQESLELLSIKDYTSFFSLNSQSTHRLNVFQSWIRIAQENGYELDSDIVGKHTLDIGCGQGDMTALFAAVLKAQGHKESRVTGVDPASLDYGAPWTLGEAQSSLSVGPLQEYLDFKQTTAAELVSSRPRGAYTAAYFVHSLYYFPSSMVLIQNFKALLDSGVKILLLAEWSLSISKPAALPHLLAILLQSIDPLLDGNVRTVLSPAAYVSAATQAGWEFVGGETFTPAAELEDGKWETRIAQSIAKKSGIVGQLTPMVVGRDADSIRTESIRAHADALEVSLTSEAGTNEAECMDVWTAVFKHPNLAHSSSCA